MKKSTTLLPSLLLGLAIALSNSGYAEAKEMDSNSKHVTTHSSKSTAKHSPATKKVVVKNKKSVKVKSEKIATAPKDVKKSKTVAKSKKSKADSRIAKNSPKTEKATAHKFKPSTKIEREAQRKDRTREKLAKISRTGKVSQVAKYAAKPIIIAAAPIAAIASTRLNKPVSIQQSSNTPFALSVESRAALVMNAVTGEVLYAKNTEQALPIASITKLMTVMVVLDAAQALAD